MKPNEYKSKASAKVRTRYHIVLVTKYRKRALEGIEEDVIDSIREAEQRSRFTIHRINTGDGSHVHMLVSIPPDETISGTVSRIKQLTTHELWGRHPDHLRRYYWGKHHKLWSAGYYCETVGRNSESIIERYIDEQQQAGRFIRDTEDDAAFSPKQKKVKLNQRRVILEVSTRKKPKGAIHNETARRRGSPRKPHSVSVKIYGVYADPQQGRRTPQDGSNHNG